jgi:hypothetical protein
VPGRVGDPQLAVVHGGEQVIPVSRTGGGRDDVAQRSGSLPSVGAGSVTNNFTANFHFPNGDVRGFKQSRAQIENDLSRMGQRAQRNA